MSDDDMDSFDDDDEFEFEEPEEVFNEDEDDSQDEDEDALMCDECHCEKATVHITDLAGDKPVQKHLCKNCARKTKEYPEIDESEIYAHLLGQIIPELKDLETKICPECKMSYLSFRHVGRLGCSKCYEAFDKVLEPMIERIHGAKQHVGKLPPTANQDVALESRIRTLEQLMQEAVTREDYERAARLRDEIRNLKAQLDD